MGPGASIRRRIQLITCLVSELRCNPSARARAQEEAQEEEGEEAAVPGRPPREARPEEQEEDRTAALIFLHTGVLHSVLGTPPGIVVRVDSYARLHSS